VSRLGHHLPTRVYLVICSPPMQLGFGERASREIKTRDVTSPGCDRRGQHLSLNSYATSKVSDAPRRPIGGHDGGRRRVRRGLRQVRETTRDTQRQFARGHPFRGGRTSLNPIADARQPQINTATTHYNIRLARHADTNIEIIPWSLEARVSAN